MAKTLVEGRLRMDWTESISKPMKWIVCEGVRADLGMFMAKPKAWSQSMTQQNVVQVNDRSHPVGPKKG